MATNINYMMELIKEYLSGKTPRQNFGLEMEYLKDFRLNKRFYQGPQKKE